VLITFNPPAIRRVFHARGCTGRSIRHGHAMLASDEPPPVTLPITGELDLHTFDPRDLPGLLPAWLAECHAHGLQEVRIIHGKGTGTLRARVHAFLRRSPLVRSFHPGNEFTGSWGATIVILRS
jgi:dsDNA-specific endonuclease/ATPase MutS2